MEEKANHASGRQGQKGEEGAAVRQACGEQPATRRRPLALFLGGWAGHRHALESGEGGGEELAEAAAEAAVPAAADVLYVGDAVVEPTGGWEADRVSRHPPGTGPHVRPDREVYISGRGLCENGAADGGGGSDLL